MVFISDNGPTTTATIPEEINMGSAGPFRGELGDATEGSIRTVGMVKWPGQIEAGGVAYGMVSIMDFSAHLCAMPSGLIYPLTNRLMVWTKQITSRTSNRIRIENIC